MLARSFATPHNNITAYGELKKAIILSHYMREVLRIETYIPKPLSKLTRSAVSKAGGY